LISLRSSRGGSVVKMLLVNPLKLRRCAAGTHCGVRKGIRKKIASALHIGALVSGNYSTCKGLTYVLSL